jgi:ribonuclease HII
MARRPLADLPPLPTLEFEQSLWQAGVFPTAGLDEAGRGAWAGPVAAAAVILPPDDADLLKHLHGVRDSKQMTARAREGFAAVIRETALAWGVGFASVEEIETHGIVPATRLAMMRALQECALSPRHLLIDALRLPDIALPQTSLIKGDARSLSIAAASVLAKTARDPLMRDLARQYPQYGFEVHKGYGTARHRRALQQWGPCPLHRRTYRPVMHLSDLWKASAAPLPEPLEP